MKELIDAAQLVYDAIESKGYVNRKNTKDLIRIQALGIALATAKRKMALRELTQLSQELGLYYDTAPTHESPQEKPSE